MNCMLHKISAKEKSSERLHDEMTQSGYHNNSFSSFQNIIFTLLILEI